MKSVNDTHTHTHTLCSFFCVFFFNEVLTDTLKPNVVVVEAAAAVAGVAGEEVGTLAVLADLRSKHFALVGIW